MPVTKYPAVCIRCVPMSVIDAGQFDDFIAFYHSAKSNPDLTFSRDISVNQMRYIDYNLYEMWIKHLQDQELIAQIKDFLNETP